MHNTEESRCWPSSPSSYQNLLFQTGKINLITSIFQNPRHNQHLSKSKVNIDWLVSIWFLALFQGLDWHTWSIVSRRDFWMCRLKLSWLLEYVPSCLFVEGAPHKNGVIPQCFCIHLASTCFLEKGDEMLNRLENFQERQQHKVHWILNFNRIIGQCLWFMFQ